MIYYALRSSRRYLALLREVSRSTEEHQILSVVGGLAFLHAIGPATKRLSLVDVDEDAWPYCRLVLRLIDMSTSVRDLLSLLTGRSVADGEWVGRPLGPPRDRRAEVVRGLGDATLERLYAETYGAMRLDPESAIGTVGKSTIRFFGTDLTPWVFSWDFGEGNLADDDRYSMLKTALSSIPLEFRLASFETLDYAEWTSPDQPPLHALVSNCDGPQFTFNDAILRRMRATALGPIRYRSWVRDCEVQPAAGESIVEPIAAIVRGARVDEVAPFGDGGPALAVGAAEHRRFASANALREVLPYDRDVLLYRGAWGRSPRASARRARVEEVLQIAAPNFRWLVFCDSGRRASAADYLEWLHHGGLEHGYRIVLLQWAADGFVVAWRRRDGSAASP